MIITVVDFTVGVLVLNWVGRPLFNADVIFD